MRFGALQILIGKKSTSGELLLLLLRQRRAEAIQFLHRSFRHDWHRKRI
jgi:hypothetical protein